MSILYTRQQVMHGQTDSGGSNIERLAGKSVDELKEACSEMAECVGFNQAPQPTPLCEI